MAAQSETGADVPGNPKPESKGRNKWRPKKNANSRSHTFKSCMSLNVMYGGVIEEPFVSSGGLSFKHGLLFSYPPRNAAEQAVLASRAAVTFCSR